MVYPIDILSKLAITYTSIASEKKVGKEKLWTCLTRSLSQTFSFLERLICKSCIDNLLFQKFVSKVMRYGKGQNLGHSGQEAEVRTQNLADRSPELLDLLQEEGRAQPAPPLI